ncbi:peptidoglycan-binding protein [Rhodobacteraceae bacterium CCMM004]|nr:peptidoglycan-binding protein [Rhodobacteraceae bacterium CCMM004]
MRRATAARGFRRRRDCANVPAERPERPTSSMVRLSLAAVLALAACVPQPQVARFAEPALAPTGAPSPDDADPSVCHARDDTPAVIETVTEQRLVAEAVVDADGAVVTPARYRTETQQRIVEGRAPIWFETPCRWVFTEDFIASLQRALIARDLMAGPATGEMDDRTRRALRAFQRDQGLNTDKLSTAGAKRLGLLIYERDDLPG